MYFHTSQRDYAGGVYIYFTSTPQYKIYFCTTSRTNFQTDLPTAKEKVWRITKTRNSEDIRIQIHCNEVEVVNILMSDTTCSVSNWNSYWSRDVRKIHFTSWDTATDFYKSPETGTQGSTEIPVKILPRFLTLFVKYM